MDERRNGPSDEPDGLTRVLVGAAIALALMAVVIIGVGLLTEANDFFVISIAALVGCVGTFLYDRSRLGRS